MSASAIRSTLAGILMVATATGANAQEQQPVEISDVPTITALCAENKSVLENFGFAADSDLAKHYGTVNASYAQRLEAAGVNPAPCQNLR